MLLAAAFFCVSLMAAPSLLALATLPLAAQSLPSAKDAMVGLLPAAVGVQAAQVAQARLSHYCVIMSCYEEPAHNLTSVTVSLNFSTLPMSLFCCTASLDA